MKKFCLYLKKHATEIINCEKKEIMPLTEKSEKKYKKQPFCEITKKNNEECIDSVRFMLSSFLILVSNLAEEPHKGKWIYCKSCLGYVNMKGGLFLFNCSYRNENNKKEFVEDVANIFESSCKICDGDIKKVCLMLREGVYLYEYIDIWKKISKTKLPTREKFCNNLR